MFDSLSDKLQDIIAKTAGQKELTQDNMQEALREIRRALLEADVNLRVVKAFISNIKDKAEGENVLQGVNPSQQLVKIVHDELIELLGKEVSPLDFSGRPNLIMMLGLQGSGKTTSSAKLAVKLKKENRNPLMVACEVYRHADITQLKALGEQIGIEVYSEDSKDVQAIIQNAINYANENGFNTLILDTAGRLQIDTEMMAELLLIDRIFHPAEKLLVVDSMTGQEAVNVAENFDAQLGVTGLVLTKLDGDSRGGAALSVVYCTHKPIKLTGTGEKLNALEDFYPERMATRILGMGDIVSLVERAQEVFDEKTAKEMEKKMAKAKFQDTLKNGLTGVATVGKKIVDTAGDGAAAAISKGKEQLDKANQKKDEALSSQQMVDILDVCYDKALQGIPKVSKSVDELAEDYSCLLYTSPSPRD